MASVEVDEPCTFLLNTGQRPAIVRLDLVGQKGQKRNHNGGYDQTKATHGCCSKKPGRIQF